ncbi:MAG: hypothetical protein WD872_16960, partial [Pirellulaceae bacterium]
TSLEATLARGLDEDTELVVIIRSKRNPQTRSEIYVVDQASPELLTNIVHAARRGAGPAATAIAAAPTPAPQPQRLAQQRYPSQPVVRGQSSE